MLKADLSLIRGLTEEDHKTYHPVAVTEFSGQGKHLYYINSEHRKGIQTPTCETTKQAIEKFRPGFVIIEAATPHEKDRQGFIRHVANHVANGLQEANEVVYVAYLAIGNNIPFLGGEPSHRDIFLGMEKAGYSTKDMEAFYLLRNIPFWKGEKEEPLDALRFLEIAEEELKKIRTISGKPLKDALTLEDFVRWFDAHNTTGKSYLEIGNRDLAPQNSPSSNYFQKLQYDMDPIRERHIDTAIVDALNEHDKVLVVYGGGHLKKSRPVFEALLGSGKTMVLVPQTAPEPPLSDIKQAPSLSGKEASRPPDNRILPAVPPPGLRK